MTVTAPRFLNIAVLDTSICSKNLGDIIIMDAVWKVIKELFPKAFYVTIPTHEYLAGRGYELLREADVALIGGTNLLTSNMLLRRQWKIRPQDILRLRNIVLLGVGWWQYQRQPDPYTRTLLQRVLHPNLQHSVRDAYTQQNLFVAGLDNVLNTSCVTMWSLTPEHLATIPKDPAADVVMTLTDYKPSPEQDRQLFSALKQHYERVYCWIQGTKDYAYARQITKDEVEYIEPNLHAFNDVLRSQTIDYVGTRLHAGIRALQLQRRALIVAVDNRAAEIGRDCQLPVIDRNALDQLPHTLQQARPIAINLPQQHIDAWKSQFKSLTDMV